MHRLEALRDRDRDAPAPRRPQPLVSHRLPRTPRGVTVRRLTPEDVPALADLRPESAWIHASWGGPGGLAASGHGWAAFAKGRILSVACAYFLGNTHEDVAVVTVPDRRREHLALACVAGLTADIRARGRVPSWCCSRDNRASRLLAWTTGFRLTRAYVHHATGRAFSRPATRSASPTLTANSFPRRGRITRHSPLRSITVVPLPLSRYPQPPT
ncbi:GNAT family N-acetyltransferase [Streptomyces vinaceus]|uniref:GNAT family N-acetyltransferase n=1 Tax=Streptomyces vinaceus TaxID=1960 RepID=UPI0036810F8E